MSISSTASSVRPIGGAQRSWLRMPPVPFLLILPALLFLVVMTQAPFILTLWYSLHTWIMTSPELGKPWVGLDNFHYTVIEDPTFRDAVVNTLIMTISIIGASLVLGLAFALLLHR